MIQDVDADVDLRSIIAIIAMEVSKLLRAFLFLATILLCVSARAMEPFEGSWALTKSNCREPNDGNVRITSKMYYEHEGSCNINKQTKNGKYWVLSLSCEGEGERWKKTQILVPKGNTIDIGTSKTALSSLVRCKNSTQPPNWPAD